MRTVDTVPTETEPLISESTSNSRSSYQLENQDLNYFRKYLSDVVDSDGESLTCDEHYELIPSMTPMNNTLDDTSADVLGQTVQSHQHDDWIGAVETAAASTEGETNRAIDSETFRSQRVEQHCNHSSGKMIGTWPDEDDRMSLITPPPDDTSQDDSPDHIEFTPHTRPTPTPPSMSTASAFFTPIVRSIENMASVPSKPLQLHVDTTSTDAVSVAHSFTSNAMSVNPLSRSAKTFRRLQTKLDRNQTSKYYASVSHSARPTMSFCRNVSVVVRVSAPGDITGNFEGMCLFPNVVSKVDEPTSQTGSGRYSPTETLATELIPESDEVIVVNPLAFGKVLPSIVTVETAWLLSQVSPKSTEDWVRHFRFDDILWPTQVNMESSLINDICIAVISDAVHLRHSSTLFSYGAVGSKRVESIFGSLAVNINSTYNPNDLCTVDAVGKSLGMLGLTVFSYLQLTMNLDGATRKARTSITISIIEIVDEDVLRDLLVDGVKSGMTLKVRHPDSMGAVVENVLELPIESLEDLYECVKNAFHAPDFIRARKLDGGRGHIIATLKIFHDSNNDDVFTPIQFLDLASADSEKWEFISSLGKTKAEMNRIHERRTANVRKSLSCLRGILRSLRIYDAQHAPRPSLPYRESTLTKLIQRSLDIDTGRAIFIATVDASRDSYAQTLQTLIFSHQMIVGQAHTAESPFHRKDDSKNAQPKSISRFFNKKDFLQSLVSDPRQRVATLMTTEPSDEFEKNSFASESNFTLPRTLKIPNVTEQHLSDSSNTSSGRHDDKVYKPLHKTKSQLKGPAATHLNNSDQDTSEGQRILSSNRVVNAEQSLSPKSICDGNNPKANDSLTYGFSAGHHIMEDSVSRINNADNSVEETTVTYKKGYGDVDPEKERLPELNDDFVDIHQSALLPLDRCSYRDWKTDHIVEEKHSQYHKEEADLEHTNRLSSGTDCTQNVKKLFNYTNTTELLNSSHDVDTDVQNIELESSKSEEQRLFPSRFHQESATASEIANIGERGMTLKSKALIIDLVQGKAEAIEEVSVLCLANGFVASSEKIGSKLTPKLHTEQEAVSKRSLSRQNEVAEVPATELTQSELAEDLHTKLDYFQSISDDEHRMKEEVGHTVTFETENKILEERLADIEEESRRTADDLKRAQEYISKMEMKKKRTQNEYARLTAETKNKYNRGNDRPFYSGSGVTALLSCKSLNSENFLSYIAKDESNRDIPSCRSSLEISVKATDSVSQLFELGSNHQRNELSEGVLNIVTLERDQLRSEVAKQQEDIDLLTKHIHMLTSYLEQQLCETNNYFCEMKEVTESMKHLVAWTDTTGLFVPVSPHMTGSSVDIPPSSYPMILSSLIEVLETRFTRTYEIVRDLRSSENVRMQDAAKLQHQFDETLKQIDIIKESSQLSLKKLEEEHTAALKKISDQALNESRCRLSLSEKLQLETKAKGELENQLIDLQQNMVQIIQQINEKQEADNNSLKSVINEKDNVIRSLTDKLAIIETQLSEKDASIESHQLMLSDLTTTLNESKHAYEVAISSLRTSLDEERESISSYKKSLEAEAAEREGTLLNQITSLENNLKILKLDSNSVSTALRCQLQSMAADFQTKVSAFEEENEALLHDLTSLTDSQELVKMQLSEAANKTLELEAKVADLEDKLATERQLSVDARHRNESLKRSIISNEERIRSEMNELKVTMEMAIVRKNEKFEALHKKFAEEKRSADRTIEKLQRSVEELERELSERIKGCDNHAIVEKLGIRTLSSQPFALTLNDRVESAFIEFQKGNELRLKAEEFAAAMAARAKAGFESKDKEILELKLALSKLTLRPSREDFEIVTRERDEARREMMKFRALCGKLYCQLCDSDELSKALCS